MYLKQLLILVLFCCIITQAQNTEDKEFNLLNKSKQWQLEFKDSGTKDWHYKWFLDGLQANVTNSKAGMLFTAGATAGEDSDHAVLWTKDSFKGNLKMEFNFTRKDAATKWAIILYLQATGIGTAPYVEDISKWNNLRTIPAMKTYFTNMKALHISYSSFENDNNDSQKDYVRVRQYPVKKGLNFNTTTEIPNAFLKLDFLKQAKHIKLPLSKPTKNYFLM